MLYKYSANSGYECMMDHIKKHTLKELDNLYEKSLNNKRDNIIKKLDHYTNKEDITDYIIE